MHIDSVDAALEKFRAGDQTAIEQLFVEYEPVLRRLARRLLSRYLRTQLDSLDLVQTVWMHVLEKAAEADWDFADRTSFEAFLVRILRRRLIDHMRRMRSSQRRELQTGPDQARRQNSQPGPGARAEAQELWARMQALCPPQHLPVLELKQQGLSVEEIAQRTRLHPSSVRRIVYELARKLALSDK